MSIKLTEFLAHDLGHLIPNAIDNAGLSAEVDTTTHGGTGTGTAILVLEASKETNHQGIRVIVEVSARRVRNFARLATELKKDLLAKCEEVLAGKEVTDEVVTAAVVTKKLQGRCEPPQEMTMVLKLQTFDPNPLKLAAMLIQLALTQLDSKHVDVKADYAKDELRVFGAENRENLQFLQETFRVMTVEFAPVGDDGPEPAETTDGNLEILRDVFETLFNSLISIDEYIVVNARIATDGSEYLEIAVSDEETVKDVQLSVDKVNQLFADNKVVS